MIDEEEGDFMIYHTNEYFNKLIQSLDRTEKEKSFFMFYLKNRKSIVKKGFYPYFYLKNELFSFLGKTSSHTKL